MVFVYRWCASILDTQLCGQDDLISVVKGYFLGALCSEPRVVPVAVHRGYEDHPRNVDLYTDMWVEPEPDTHGGVVDLNDLGACVREYPYGAPRVQPFSFSIIVPVSVCSYHLDSVDVATMSDCATARVQKTRRASIPRNKLYSKLMEFTNLRTVVGNILVVKSDRLGHVCDVLERDLYFIERLLYRYDLDAAPTIACLTPFQLL